MTDPLGYQTVYGYDADGNEVSVDDPMGRITTTVRRAGPARRSSIDPMGNRVTTTYDADGETLTVTDALNRTTTYTYSVRGWVATVTDPDGLRRHLHLLGDRQEAVGQYQTSRDPASSRGLRYLRRRRPADRAGTDGLGRSPRPTPTTAWATSRASRTRMGTYHVRML